MSGYFPAPATHFAIETSDPNWDWNESPEAEDARLCREYEAAERRKERQAVYEAPHRGRAA